MISSLRAQGITAPFHYVPLHSSDAGLRFSRAVGTLAHTDDVSDRLIRLPMWAGMRDEIERVVAVIHDLIR
jgi:dTDP-4-amino-4,6-dideoxygalactose transaminase